MKTKAAADWTDFCSVIFSKTLLAFCWVYRHLLRFRVDFSLYWDKNWSVCFAETTARHLGLCFFLIRNRTRDYFLWYSILLFSIIPQVGEYRVSRLMIGLEFLYISLHSPRCDYSSQREHFLFLFFLVTRKLVQHFVFFLVSLIFTSVIILNNYSLQAHWIFSEYSLRIRRIIVKRIARK
jgi:hypothetical protein